MLSKIGFRPSYDVYKGAMRPGAIVWFFIFLYLSTRSPPGLVLSKRFSHCFGFGQKEPVCFAFRVYTCVHTFSTVIDLNIYKSWYQKGIISCSPPPNRDFFNLFFCQCDLDKGTGGIGTHKIYKTLYRPFRAMLERRIKSLEPISKLWILLS